MRRITADFLYDDKDALNSHILPAQEEGETSERRLLRQALRDVITEQLSPRQKDYLMLYYYEGLTMCEIAARYAVNVSTVSRTIARAKARIARFLHYFPHRGRGRGTRAGIQGA